MLSGVEMPPCPACGDQLGAGRASMLRFAIAVAVVVAAGCQDPRLDRGRGAILGGSASDGDPAVVAFLEPALDCGDAPQPFCTGTLIGPRAVLTAAHCLSDPEALVVFAGDDASEPEAGVLVAVHDRWLHPDYDGAAHDIAIAELEEPLATAPIALASEVTSDDVGALVRVVGYGVADDGSMGRKRHGTSRIEELRADELVAVPMPANSCQGDSGGPVFIDRGGSEVLVAVASSGDPRCVLTSVNTRVDSHRPFIDETLADIASRRAPDPTAADEPCSGGGCSSTEDARGQWAFALLLLCALRRRALL